MAGDLSRWMGAVSDVDAAHKSANNPSMLRKVLSAKSIEEEAIEAFTAKKQMEQQRNDLRTFIQFSQGQSRWEELLRMEADIRKRRQKEIYDKKIFREKVINYVAIGSGFCCRYWCFGAVYTYPYGVRQRMVVTVDTIQEINVYVNKVDSNF